MFHSYNSGILSNSPIGIMLVNMNWEVYNED